jgi:hypothetical protein
MFPPRFIVLALLALVAVAIAVVYVQAARDSRGEPQNTVKVASAASSNAHAEPPSDTAAASGPTEALSNDPGESHADSHTVSNVKSVSQSIAETASGDPATRAAAILALASAPKIAALPVLRNVLENGEPSIDRPLALRSLRDLALHQGDEDGAIRSVVREAIYHGDDEAVVQSAQGALEIIEESELK